METMELLVIRREEQAPGIISLELARPDGRPLPHFDAGAHIDLHLGPGLVRQYSLCNAPGEREVYEIGVLREPNSRGGSLTVHERALPGERMTVGGPRNLFELGDAGHYVLVGAGIGITPILAMAEALAASGRSFEAHYFVRAESHIAFRRRITSTPLARHFHVHVNGPDGTDMAAVDTMLARPAGDRQLYVCGPNGFIEMLREAAAVRGWNDDDIRFERFAAPPVNGATNRPFTVTLARSRQTFEIAPDQTVLSVLEGAGVDIPFSCEQGVCGACVTTVLAGEIDHRDSYLSAAEKAGGRLFMPCCSRARSDCLVLDI
ncbi:PDR/VanB family oxidoreductase [Paraburkholderia silviterrae]|uniref:Oxidoreductase n=1 Tax=Paraburkholderia silviterrae TaxID=2528715 RepID=A0A4R5M4E0_9BURK|nr:PDR/VanB family oxidoreductase [Paraburkholderia silviterrae]TDG20580.1 oxidoreductase [Paraburkholderia silviterrae]